MLQETIILTALYVLIIGILYAPKCPKMTTTDAPIDYFPSVEESPEKEPTVTPAVTLPPSSESLEMAIAANVTPSETLPILADKPAAVTVSPDLKSLSIRQLKKMAQGRIKNYSNLTKGQLIQALAA